MTRKKTVKRRRNRWYIAGRVTGLPYSVAWDNFLKAERAIYELGGVPVNPLRFCLPRWSWRRCMTTCILNLLLCRFVAMQPNWKQSRGARIERRIALICHKTILYL